MSAHIVEFEITTPDGEDVSLPFTIRRLPFLRATAIQERGLAALEACGVMQTLSDALGTVTGALSLNLPTVEGDGSVSDKARGLLKAWISGQDMSAVVDGLREVISTHLLPTAMTLPAVMRAACAAAVDILDNEVNHKKHRRALNLSDPKKERGFFVSSPDLRVYLEQSIQPDVAIEVVIEWLVAQRVREALGKLLPLAKMAADKGAEKTKG